MARFWLLPLSISVVRITLPKIYFFRFGCPNGREEGRAGQTFRQCPCGERCQGISSLRYTRFSHCRSLQAVWVSETLSVVGTPCAPLKVPMRSGCVLPLCLVNTESCSYCCFFPLMCYSYVGERAPLNNRLQMLSVSSQFIDLIWPWPVPYMPKTWQRHSMRGELPYDTHIAYTLKWSQHVSFSCRNMSTFLTLFWGQWLRYTKQTTCHYLEHVWDIFE